MKPVALVDLDGTLVDFDAAVRRDMAKVAAPGEEVPPLLEDIMSVPHLKARYDLIKMQPEWWFNLAPIEQGMKVTRIMADVGLKIVICTRGPKNYGPAWDQKCRWARANLPHAGIVVTLDKAIIYGRVLMDDWPDYVLPWLKHRPRGLVIMPDRPWNKDCHHPQILRLTDNFDEIKEALIKQATRRKP